MNSPNSGSSEQILAIDELVQTIEALPDQFARSKAVELVQAVMGLHASALARILAVAAASPHGGGEAVVQAIAADELVAAVLAMHGLHPDNTETRVRRAVDRLDTHFATWGAHLVLVSADADQVRLRFSSNRPGAGPAARRLIEDAIFEAAPEIESLSVEGVEEAPQKNGFVPLEALMATAPQQT